MPTSLSGRNFLKLLDFTPDEIRYLIKLSTEFKNLKLTGTPHRYLEGKNIVLLFEKTSTRTRCAFEVGGMDLGMGVTYLDPGSSQMGKKESIEDLSLIHISRGHPLRTVCPLDDPKIARFDSNCNHNFATKPDPV